MKIIKWLGIGVGCIVALIVVAGVVQFFLSPYRSTSAHNVSDTTTGTAYQITVPTLLAQTATNGNTFTYQSSGILSTELSVRSESSKETIEGTIKPALKSVQVQNHELSTTASLPLGYSHGVDSFEDITINNKQGIFTKTTYNIAGSNNSNLNVLSVSWPCGSGSICSVWLATNDSKWTDTKQSLIATAQSVSPQ